MTLPAVEELEAAVAAGDRDAFTAAYDRLTTACNDCHVAAGRGAIVISGRRRRR
jgi:cytochrome c556